MKRYYSDTESVDSDDLTSLDPDASIGTDMDCLSIASYDDSNNRQESKAGHLVMEFDQDLTLACL
jgi:hypothetical protein